MRDREKVARWLFDREWIEGKWDFADTMEGGKEYWYRAADEVLSLTAQPSREQEALEKLRREESFVLSKLPPGQVEIDALNQATPVRRYRFLTKGGERSFADDLDDAILGVPATVAHPAPRI